MRDDPSLGWHGREIREPLSPPLQIVKPSHDARDGGPHIDVGWDRLAEEEAEGAGGYLELGKEGGDEQEDIAEFLVGGFGFVDEGDRHPFRSGEERGGVEDNGAVGLCTQRT